MKVHGQEPLPFENIQDEIFDMVKPAQPDRITLKDLLNWYGVDNVKTFGCLGTVILLDSFSSEQGDTVISILIDLNGFWNHENREMMAAETTTDISRN